MFRSSSAERAGDRREGLALTGQWTRTQRIRTAARLGVAVAIVEPVALPLYQRIAEKAGHLRALGMSDRAIARVLQVSDKTAAKAADWAGAR